MSQTQYLTLNQFAQETCRGTRYIKALTDSGELTTTLINGRTYYLQSEVAKAKQVKTLTQAEELKNIKQALAEVINKTKSKFKEQAEEIKSQYEIIKDQSSQIFRLSEKVEALEIQKTLDDWPDNSPAQPAPAQNTVAPTTHTLVSSANTEPALPEAILEKKQRILEEQHALKLLEEASQAEAQQKKAEATIAKKIESGKINSQTKVNSTLKGQKQQEEEAAKQVRLAHRANLAELNRTYILTQTQLEEMDHFLNLYLEEDGNLYYINDPAGHYSTLFECHALLTANNKYHEYIKKEYQHLYHVTESGIVDLVTGHSSLLDFVSTLHSVTGNPVNSVDQTNSHTINIPSNPTEALVNSIEAYPATWYKFIADHPQPYQHEHNPPDIDLSYTDLLDVTNPADADAYAAAQSVHQQQINKWVRFRQGQGLLP